MVRIDADTGRLWRPDRGTVFADSLYVHSLRGRVADRANTVFSCWSLMATSSTS